MSSSTIYVDYLSQPCRALGIFVRMNKLNVKEKNIQLLQGEQKTEAYRKLCPSGKVPALVDEDGWNLSESIAIAQYLCQKESGISDHWYPKDVRARASVDEFLHYHHGLRSSCVEVFIPVVFAKDGKVDTVKVKESCVKLENTLTNVENLFLKDRDFVGGSEISLGDLWAVNEIWQLLAVGYDITKNHPKLTAWVDRVKAAVQPHFDDLTKTINGMGAARKFDFSQLDFTHM